MFILLLLILYMYKCLLLYQLKPWVINIWVVPFWIYTSQGYRVGCTEYIGASIHVLPRISSNIGCGQDYYWQAICSVIHYGNTSSVAITTNPPSSDNPLPKYSPVTMTTKAISSRPVKNYFLLKQYILCHLNWQLHHMMFHMTHQVTHHMIVTWVVAIGNSIRDTWTPRYLMTEKWFAITFTVKPANLDPDKILTRIFSWGYSAIRTPL